MLFAWLEATVRTLLDQLLKSYKWSAVTAIVAIVTLCYLCNDPRLRPANYIVLEPISWILESSMSSDRNDLVLIIQNRSYNKAKKPS